MMHLNGFFAYLQFEKRYSDHTIQAYRNDLAQLQDFLHGQGLDAGDDLISLGYRQVRTWIMHMMADGMQPRSVHRKISSLRTYFRYLRKKGVISQNPMTKVVVPRSGKPLPLFIDTAGMEVMFDNLVRQYPEQDPLDIFEKSRDLLILDILYKTGIRRAELLSLQERSFDRSSRNIRVVGKGNKERIVPLGEETLRLLEDYLAQRINLFGSGGALLLTRTGKPAYPNMIYRLVRKSMEGATTLSRKSPHVLRHTFATHLSNNGAELNAVKELLGHASLASTQVYTHNSIDQLKEIYKRAHPKGS